VAVEAAPPRLLLVEPDGNDARLVARELGRKGYDVQLAGRLSEALSRLAVESFDLVLAADVLPDGSPLELLARPGPPPVVLLSEELHEERVRRALEAGTLDVLLKDGGLLPLLELRLSRVLAHRRDRERLADALEENRRLHTANRLLVEISMKDPLTGVFNRRGFDEALRREVSRASRAKDDLSVAYFDLDHFKSINDEHGHEAGDAVLRAFAEVLRHQARGLDVISRVGGDEFATLLPSAPLAGALRYAERVRSTFENVTVSYEGIPLSTTVSGGAAPYSDGMEFLRAADEHLYRAKAAGRNRIVAIDVS
jgi:two-component system, cell cycle response regulator